MIKHTRTVGKEYLVTKMKNSNWHGGKGSTPRTNTNSKQYQDNWDKIFKDKQVKDVNTTQVKSEETQQKT